MEFARKEFEFDIEPVKIVGAESCLKNGQNLVVIANRFKFFSSATDGEVVDDNLALFESAVGYSTQFTQFKIAQALNSDPNADSQHSENQAQRTARGPKKKQTEKSEHG